VTVLEGEAGGRTPTVLVVDDEPGILGFLEFALADEGFNVETAADGLAALRSVARTPPTVVVTDLMMPRLDGFGLIRRLRDAHEPLRGIIAMSAVRGGDDPPAGADLFVAKPFEIERMIACIRALLDGGRR
jgi:two-component system, OmpR family, response regulator MprA